VHINVDAKAEDGAVTSWKFEVGSPNGLMRSGWTRYSLKPGDAVTVEGFRAKNVSNLGAAKTITANGKRMFVENPNSAVPSK
jgi:outer membrane usher protein FimD/PapC